MTDLALLHPHVRDSAGLLLLAHGSRDARHAQTMDRIATVTATSAGRPVRVAYLDHHGPDLTEAAAGLAADCAPAVVAVPLLLSEAFHRKVDVPAAVDAARAALTVGIHLAPPLGPDPSLLTAAHRRLRQAGGNAGPGTGVVFAYAGTTDQAAAAAVTRLARMWESRYDSPTRVVHAGVSGLGLLDAVDSLHAAGADRIEVCSWFLAPGRLSERIAQLAGAVGADVVGEPLGAAPEVITAVLARAGASRARNAA